MEILITNDDGWGSKGIITLTRQMMQLGHVTVVAPEGPRSGRAAAISVLTPMYLRQLKDKPEEFAEADIYLTNGTPADCIKLAINAVFHGDDSKINLVVSGINHGHNASVNLIYSGTMGACLVAAEHGLPAIGYSINDHNPDVDFTYMLPYINHLAQHLLAEGIERGTCYNINAPVGPIAGIKWARQCSGHWTRELEPHTDDKGETYYILIGDFVNHEPDANDTDLWALDHGYISIQPVSIDLTAHHLL